MPRDTKKLMHVNVIHFIHQLPTTTNLPSKINVEMPIQGNTGNLFGSFSKLKHPLGGAGGGGQRSAVYICENCRETGKEKKLHVSVQSHIPRKKYIPRTTYLRFSSSCQRYCSGVALLRIHSWTRTSSCVCGWVRSQLYLVLSTRQLPNSVQGNRALRPTVRTTPGVVLDDWLFWLRCCLWPEQSMTGYCVRK